MSKNIGVYFILIWVVPISGEFLYRIPNGLEESIIHTLGRYRRQSTKCKSYQFQCDSNDCISEERLCDGKADCPDSSDETLKACSGFLCNTHKFFRCDYGACLLNSIKCNKINDCFDGSDERNCPAATHSGSQTAKVTRSTVTDNSSPRGCLIPNHPNNGEYKLGRENATPGEYAAMYKPLVLQCKEPAYKPNPPTIGSRAVIPYCLEGKWVPTVLPTCSTACKPLLSTTTTKITCKHGDQILDNCDNPVDNTIASVECEPFHEMPEFSHNPDIWCRDGSWDYPVQQCLPVCGIKGSRNVGYIIGGTPAKKSDYPWHVAVFDASNDNICGGSIITDRIVLSAASCFTDAHGKLYPVEDYKIVAGKYYRAYDDSRDLVAQKHAIDHIYIPERFIASDNNYEADIAIIVLKEKLKASSDVQPVCVDWRNQFEQQQLIENNVGIVIGWSQTNSAELNEMRVPYKPYSDCFEHIPTNARKFLTFDKLCTVVVSQKHSVCQSDNGGGLIFQRNQNRFYIRGIVSTHFIPNETRAADCDENRYTTYTMISKYIDLIRRIESQNRS